MFEITAHDLAQLDDKQLRDLVALLCEAQLRRRGYPTSAVTWGGDQNAKDGGLDVRVNLPDDKPIDGFIPRSSTGFQVKRQDMPPRTISDEMSPRGELREVIRELAAGGGAYIIVSSQGSTSDRALKNRIEAMADAAKEVAASISLDFYDRTRLATWVRDYAGLVIWVRDKIGRAVTGWQPYDAWAHPAGGIDSEYLLEGGVRVRGRAGGNSEDLSPRDGLQKIRRILGRPASVVRLVGLSGVGKTRFVQALFDERIGDDALDPALAVYTNMTDDPNPQPFSLASDFIADGTRAILIIDNCAPDLHGRLASVVKARASAISVLTVEYDIQDDLPEGTEAFELRTASIDLVEKLIRIRFRNLSQIDSRTAAEFSGGNARIAIALAETVERGETLAKLSDTQLFERLFVQRQGRDRSLLETAQACALVYSFNGEDVSESEEAELYRIAGLSRATAEEVYRDVAKLLRRELAQRRGKWRAILPHALANRLAATALENLPPAHIHKYLVDGAPERLTISFSRRLGYLNDSNEAIKIVREWLGPTGWIGEHVWNLNEFGKAIFRNSLPAAPESGLRALEANVPPHNHETPITTGEYVPQVLRSLAWDVALFERCLTLLEVLVVFGEGSAKEAAEIHSSLFAAFLSGTHATVEQRAAVIQRLLRSDNIDEQSLGIAALSSMLKCNDFSSNYDFQFGAHSRDYGYHPKNNELRHWYKTAFAVAEEVALTGNAAAKAVISNKFRGLWTQALLRDELEAIVPKFAAQGFWSDGWLAVKHTRFYDEKDKASGNYARLSKLEEILRPRDLIQQVRGRVLASDWYDFDEVESDDADHFRVAFAKRQDEAKALGSEVAADGPALHELIPDIVRRGSNNLMHFGMGLAQGAKDQKQFWQQIVRQFGEVPIKARGTGALCGFLLQLESDKSPLLDELLDAAVDNEPLAPFFPILQGLIVVTPRGMSRLNRSLQLGKAPIHMYDIPLARAVETVPAADIAAYLISLAEQPEGEPVAIHLLSMQFFGDRNEKRPHATEIVDAGRVILSHLNFDRGHRREDFSLQGVVEVCASGDRGYNVAKTLFANLKQAVAEHRSSGFDHDKLLNGLFKAQPRAGLEALLTGEEKAIKAGVNLIDQAARIRSNPVDGVSEATLLEWCAEDPRIRFPAAAAVVSAFILEDDKNPVADQNPVSWTPIASHLVYNAPEPLAVMRVLVGRVKNLAWRGVSSTLLQRGVTLLDLFDVRGDAGLAAFIGSQKIALQQQAREYLDLETDLDRDLYETFE
jgi:hypothetical protein